jgi:hypothetical protein
MLGCHVTGCDGGRSDAPYSLHKEWVDMLVEKYNVDFVVHGDDPCVGVSAAHSPLLCRRCCCSSCCSVAAAVVVVVVVVAVVV